MLTKFLLANLDASEAPLTVPNAPEAPPGCFGRSHGAPQDISDDAKKPMGRFR